MLIFVDQDKHVRVVRTRTEDGATSRSPLGRIAKNRFEMDDDLRALLSPEEIGQVESVVDVYKRAASVQAEFFALNFPAITREVMDRFEDGASDAERQVIMGALMEAVRRMRKFERESQPA